MLRFFSFFVNRKPASLSYTFRRRVLLRPRSASSRMSKAIHGPMQRGSVQFLKMTSYHIGVDGEVGDVDERDSEGEIRGCQHLKTELQRGLRFRRAGQHKTSRQGQATTKATVGVSKRVRCKHQALLLQTEHPVTLGRHPLSSDHIPIEQLRTPALPDGLHSDFTPDPLDARTAGHVDSCPNESPNLVVCHVRGRGRNRSWRCSRTVESRIVEIRIESSARCCRLPE